MRQHKNIDVLVTINSAYAVCIEDKVGTIEHSNQLDRYIAELLAEGFTREHIVPIYVQTCEQSSYEAVQEAGYALLPRGTLIDILKPYSELPNANDTVRDFCSHLENVDRRFTSFRDRPPSEWQDPYAWQGFFCEIQTRLGDGRWEYVANQSGGFQGYFWHEMETSECTAYIQLEEEALCFRIVVEEKDRRALLRNQWHALIVEEADILGVDVVRPKSFGNGRTMTVAVLNGDYRRTDRSGHLDLGSTIEALRQAEAVLDHAIANVGSEKD